MAPQISKKTKAFEYISSEQTKQFKSSKFLSNFAIDYSILLFRQFATTSFHDNSAKSDCSLYYKSIKIFTKLIPQLNTIQNLRKSKTLNQKTNKTYQHNR